MGCNIINMLIIPTLLSPPQVVQVSEVLSHSLEWWVSGWEKTGFSSTLERLIGSGFGGFQFLSLGLQYPKQNQ